MICLIYHDEHDSHYSEVFDPPVSSQIDEGATNRQSDTTPWHQAHHRFG